MFREIQHHLEPGHVFASKEQTIVRTVLGSCVAVCLWDSRIKCGGINHFLYPRTTERAKATPQYGNAAMLCLVRMMAESGCSIPDMVAQVYGGASREESAGDPVGDRNVAVACGFLEKKGIRIVAHDVGGSHGRRVLFNTGTGRTVVSRVPMLSQKERSPGRRMVRFEPSLRKETNSV